MAAKKEKFGGKRAPAFGKGKKEQEKNRSKSEKEPASKLKDKK